MSDGVTLLQDFIKVSSSVYAENKALLSFIGGAITFGVPHVYKIYKFFSDRQDLKDKILEELIDEAHKNKASMQNAAAVISEMILKAKSGMYWADRVGALSLYLNSVEHGKVRPALKLAEEFYSLVSGANSFSLKELKSLKVRAKKSRYANELILSEAQGRLREYGVQARLVG
ncbi:hypothetical protein [Pseudomonas sp. NFACC36]|uniref:hypothetical protein n=1 Tax=Pseudomonas sp. NFACC36 TaxID=1566197 RepID=UPI0011B0920A|nr:hypothetical protein [Pseudomonas sp. NFACC36]